MATDPKALVVQANTKETGMDLYQQVQGSLIFDELLVAHLVKLHKQFEGFP